MATRKTQAYSPSITVVIGTLNRPNQALKLLKELQKVDNIEIIVFDQSNQENYDILKRSISQNDRFNLVHLDKPNTCKYLNLGWQQAHAPIVLYLDDDVSITNKTISAHINAYKNQSILGVAGRVINDDEPVTQSSSVGQIRFFGAIIDKNFSSKKIGSVDFPYGCNMSFRRKTLEEMGGFDENIPGPIYSFNEVDLGYRITKKYPKSMVFEPDALVYHHKHFEGGSRSYNTHIAERNMNTNYGFFIGKNFSLLQNISFFLRRLPYQLIREPQNGLNILKGYFMGKRTTLTKLDLITFVILLMAIMIRFWKIPHLFIFDVDEEYQALLGWEQVKNFHITFIGVSASNTGFYLGPGLTYLDWILLSISRGDPVVFGYFASFIGTITLLSIYRITAYLYGKGPALITSLFYSFSSFIVYYDRKFWPIFIPLVATWLWYSLVRARGDQRWLLISSLLLGAALHIHLSLLLFVPFVIAAFFSIKHISKRIILGSMAIFIFAVSPLIMFDLIHNFDNLKAPFRMIAQPHSSSINLVHNLDTLLLATSKFWLNMDQVSLWIERALGASTLMVLLFVFLRRKDYASRCAGVFVSLFILLFIFYPGPVQKYYLIILFPFIVAGLGLYFAKVRSMDAYILISIFLILNLYSIIHWNDRYGLTPKKVLIQEVSTYLGAEPFYLETDPVYVSFGGWRYLFKTYGKTPSQSSADPMFGWIYPDEISKSKPSYTVLITVEPLKNTFRLIKHIHYGRYDAYIFRN